MIHLYAEGRARPVCGMAVERGESVREVYFRDLCKACRAWQARRNMTVRRWLADE